jgi:hypothetical protein
MRFPLFAALALFPLPALAQDVPTEVQTLGKAQVTVHLHPFLTAEEQAALRLVASNEQALALFVPRAGRHAAIAVAPGEGFIRGGQPVASAVAMSDLPDTEKARAAALEGCEKARTKGAACVIVLDVAPAR